MKSSSGEGFYPLTYFSSLPSLPFTGSTIKHTQYITYVKYIVKQDCLFAVFSLTAVTIFGIFTINTVCDRQGEMVMSKDKVVELHKVDLANLRNRREETIRNEAFMQGMQHGLKLVTNAVERYFDCPDDMLRQQYVQMAVLNGIAYQDVLELLEKHRKMFVVK